jgi:hypothetical protein
MADPLKNRCVKCYSQCKQCHGPTQYDCTECFNKFVLADLTFNSSCVDAIVAQYSGTAHNITCPGAPNNGEVTANANCAACLDSPNPALYKDSNCVQCWVDFGYGWGRCASTSSSGLSFFSRETTQGNQSNGWRGQGVITYACGKDYPALTGVPNLPNNSNHSTAVPTSLTSSFTNLPNHYGLSFALDLFKVDYWAFTPDPNGTNRLTPIALTVVVSSPGSVDHSFTVRLNNSQGGNICGESPNEMIWTLPGYVSDHSASSVTFKVVSPDVGIFARDLEVYLGNCDGCAMLGLAYELFLLPMYSDNDTQTGLDVFVSFNKPILFDNGTQAQADALSASFNFEIDGWPVQSSIKEGYIFNDPEQNYIKYFLPLGQSYTNATVRATTSKPDLIYA